MHTYVQIEMHHQLLLKLIFLEALFHFHKSFLFLEALKYDIPHFLNSSFVL